MNAGPTIGSSATDTVDGATCQRFNIISTKDKKFIVHSSIYSNAVVEAVFVEDVTFPRR
jgi:hypothetical protein